MTGTAGRPLHQEPLIERVRRLCAADPRLDAALTYGSFPQGEADEFSDIEFWLFFTEQPEPLEWVEQVAPVSLLAVNEFGTHVALFTNGVRGEFHFASVDDIAGVREWPGLGAPLEDVLMVDRRGALAEALADVADRVPGPGGPEDVEAIVARFAVWLAFGRAVLERGELLRAHEILGHLHRHLLWMARLDAGVEAHWATPSRAAEQDLAPDVIKRLVAATAPAEAAALADAYAEAARFGTEIAERLARAYGVPDRGSLLRGVSPA